MRYAVVIQDDEVETHVVDDLTVALRRASEARTQGQEVVGVFQEVQGNLVFEARIVPPPAVQAVSEAGEVGPRKPMRRAAKVKRRPGEKRTPGELHKLRTRAQSWIQTNPGHGIETIADALGTTTRELSLPLRHLVETGKVEKSGHRRATKYWPAKDQTPLVPGRRSSAG